MKYCIAFAFVAFTCLALGADFSIRPEGKGVTIHSLNGESAVLKAAKLFFEDKEGVTGPTEEDYLVEVIGHDYPRIVDMLDGRIANIQFADTNLSNGSVLLVFYFTGGNQYGVRIYTVNGIDVRPLRSQPVSSNMRSVKVEGKNIIVKNEEIDADGKRFISTATYAVAEGDCKLVREEKTTSR